MTKYVSETRLIKNLSHPCIIARRIMDTNNYASKMMHTIYTPGGKRAFRFTASVFRLRCSIRAEHTLQ